MHNSLIGFSLIALMGGASPSKKKYDLKLEPGAAKLQTMQPITDETNPTSFECGNYWLYYVGKASPQPKTFFGSKVKDEGTVPLAVRLHNSDGKADYYRVQLSAKDCNITIPLGGKGTGKFFLMPLTGPAPPPPPTDISTECLGGCSPCEAHPQYRITYDLSTHEICMMERNGKGEWERFNRNTMRPRIGRYLDVKYVNMNAVRDSVSLEYRYENLNLENSEEFLSAMLASSAPAAGGTPGGVGTTTAAEPELAYMGSRYEDNVEDNKKIYDQLQEIVEVNKLLSPLAGQTSMTKEPIGRADLEQQIQNKLKSLTKWDLSRTPYSEHLKELFAAADGLASKTTIQFPAGKTIAPDEFKARLKEARDALPLIEKAYQKIRTRQDLAALTEVAAQFQAELEIAQSASITPDRDQLKRKLDEILSKALPGRYDPAKGGSLTDQLKSILADGSSTDLLSADQHKTFDKLISDLELAYARMVTYRVFALAPIQVQDYDLIKLQFKLNGRPLNDSPYEIPTRGGWKLDFSTGLVFTSLRDHDFYYDDVRNETLVTPANDGSDSLITKTYGTIQESQKNQLSLNFGVMMHAYSRSGRYVNGGPSIGVMVGTSGTRVMGGGSLLLGKRQRLVVSVGVAIGNVDKLQDGRETEVEEELSPNEQNGEVPVQRDLDTGWFAGASWNFGGARLTR